MKRVLIVDDDSLILRMYQDGLAQQGFQAETAWDGLDAIKSLRASKPDLVVLDLMMPRFTGVDVLKFMRSQAELAAVPVIVLSNSYMNELGEQAAAMGVQKALLKVRCTPPILAGIIHEVLAGGTGTADSSQLLAVPASPPAAAAPRKPEAPAAKEAAKSPAVLRAEFLKSAPATIAELRELCHAVVRSTESEALAARLDELYKKVHFITGMAGMAGCEAIALLASAFEALLFELQQKPRFINPSALQTVAHTVDVLNILFARPSGSPCTLPLKAQALVVDDDPLSTRTVMAALHRAQIQSRSLTVPMAALKHLQEQRYDLFLLDVDMPGMSGFQLCERIRVLPDYHKTPIIFVTEHSSLGNRARSVLVGGNDFVTKPIFAIELAVKAVSHLVKSQAISGR